MMESSSSIQNNINWNQLISRFPKTHLLQTSQWAALKAHYGWVPSYLVWDEDQTSLHVFREEEIEAKSPVAVGLLLEREALPGLRVLYMPKGPLLSNWSDQALCERVLNDLADYARARGVIQLKIDPDLELGSGVPDQEDYQEFAEGEEFQKLLSRKGWIFSREQIQFKNTVLVDLLEEEDQILARMKSKTRYNIRLAGRKGIQIRLGGIDDLPTLYRMYAETSQRAGFTIRREDYYLKLWESFLEKGMPEDPKAQPIIAEYEGTLVAGAVIFKFGDRAWYLHGMSLPEHSEKMAPHLIQWEAMRWAKEEGCTKYDMWGAPDQFDETDSLWGVYRFKRGFGGDVSITLGAWDYPARRIGYTAYNRWLPKILDLMRWFGDRRTGQAARSLE
jgi:lipid II:glycine glycyltransferase (peptidoglycan interpeptide bridge formation enzyme)